MNLCDKNIRRPMFRCVEQVTLSDIAGTGGWFLLITGNLKSTILLKKRINPRQAFVIVRTFCRDDFGHCQFRIHDPIHFSVPPFHRFVSMASSCPARVVSVKAGKFRLTGRPCYVVGTNYWYESPLGLENDRARGLDRLREEFDFLRTNGVTSFRLMAGAEARAGIQYSVR